MPEIDEYEHEILEAYEKGSLKSIATKSEIARFRAPEEVPGVLRSEAEGQKRRRAAYGGRLG